MFEIDLLRGEGAPLDRRPRLAPPRARFRGLSPDRWTIGAGLAVTASLGVVLHLVLSLRGRTAAVQAALDAALADSVRNAALIARTRTLEARRDSIAARVAIIQEIDARRYLWPRIMDEVAGVLPGEAWLTNLSQVGSPNAGVRFQVEGLTRDNVSLTRFWNGMESSPFIHNVRLVSTGNVAAGSGAGRSEDLRFFVLQAEPEDPPPAMLDLVSHPPGDPR